MQVTVASNRDRRSLPKRQKGEAHLWRFALGCLESVWQITSRLIAAAAPSAAFLLRFFTGFLQFLQDGFDGRIGGDFRGLHGIAEILHGGFHLFARFLYFGILLGLFPSGLELVFFLLREAVEAGAAAALRKPPRGRPGCASLGVNGEKTAEREGQAGGESESFGCEISLSDGPMKNHGAGKVVQSAPGREPCLICASDTFRGKGYAFSLPPMSSNSPAGIPDQPSALRRHGCLIFVIVVVVLVLAGVLTIYHIAFGTAVPFRIFAGIMEKANPNLHIEGITGDLKTGLQVASITWERYSGRPSRNSRPACVRYNGYGDAGKTHRLVFNEIGVSPRAHRPRGSSFEHQYHHDANDNGDEWLQHDHRHDDEHGHLHVHLDGDDERRCFRPPLDGFPQGLESIEVERVSIEDVLITNRQVPDFRISIPKIGVDWIQSHAQECRAGVCSPSKATASCCTPLRAARCRSTGTTWAFQKLVTVTAQPALHPALKRSLSRSPRIFRVFAAGRYAAVSYRYRRWEAGGRAEGWRRLFAGAPARSRGYHRCEENLRRARGRPAQRPRAQSGGHRRF